MATRKRAAKAPTETAVQEDTVSDFNETEIPGTEAPEGTEPEAGTAAAGHKFNEDDRASVIRGKLRGQRGQIISYDSNGDQYAVKLESGTLAVLNAANLKAPADSTVSVQALVGVLASFQDSDPEVITRLAAALDSVAPGVSTKLNEASAS